MRKGVIGGRNGEGPRSPIGMMIKKNLEKIRRGSSVCVCERREGMMCVEIGNGIYMQRMADRDTETGRRTLLPCPLCNLEHSFLLRYTQLHSPLFSARVHKQLQVYS
jgi:hypothetical protein